MDSTLIVARQNLHMRKTPKAVETPAHKAEAQDLAAFEKMGLA